MLRPLPLLALAGAGGAAYMAYNVHRLNTTYPMHQLGYTLTTPTPFTDSTIYSPSPVSADVVCARVRLPTRIGPVPQDAFTPSLRAAVESGDLSPRDMLLAAFWSTWTLRIEALFSRVTGFRCIVGERQDGEAFASGLFSVLETNDNRVLTGFGGPLRKGSKGLAGGVQELAVTDLGGGELKVSYASAQWTAGGWEQGMLARIMFAGHRYYMRFLLDSAVQRLEEWERD